MIDKHLQKLNRGHDLSESEAHDCLVEIFQGQCHEETVIALLKALSTKGESLDEIIGFSRAMLAHCSHVDIGNEGLDLCGTGGSGLERYNVSTSVAFVLAAGGVKVAKHGNKGSRKNNGSFDLLEQLGINLATTPQQEAELFKHHGLCFLFAKTHHPAMRHVAPARAKLGQRSIFNLIGPLCNPAGVRRQIVGVSRPELGPLLAEALVRLGREKVMVVHGEPGIDELSISGINTLWTAGNSGIECDQLDPRELDLASIPYDRLPGGDCAHNARIFHRLLEGDDCGGLKDMVCLNAGAAFLLADASDSIEEGVEKAMLLLDSGRVRDFFLAYPKVPPTGA